MSIGNVAAMMGTEDEPHLHSTGVVEDIHNHDETVGLELSYMHNECFFTVLLSREHLRGCCHSDTQAPDISVIHKLIVRFNEACTWTENDKSIEDVDKRLEDIWYEAETLVRLAAFDKIKYLGRRHGCESSPHDLSRQKMKTLQRYLFPRTFNLQLIADCTRLKAVRRPDLPLWLPFTTETKIRWCAGLRSVVPDEIQVLQKYRPHVLKVQVGDSVFCCKLNNTGSQDSFLREFKALQKIRNSTLNGKIKVPHLQGLVKVSDGTIGLLTDWIEKEESDLMMRLRQTNSIAQPERHFWATDLSHTLEQLHSLDITWGDAKTSNVVIDLQHQPWIVDFGGGFTRGWVDEALQNTFEGDLQGLKHTILDIFGSR